MSLYELMRDSLRSRVEQFPFLDAVQLVKHAFGLVTEGRRKKKRPYLVYLFAEPTECAGRAIDDGTKRKHRDGVARFAAAVNGAEVRFGAMSSREWLGSWPDLVCQAHLPRRSAFPCLHSRQRGPAVGRSRISHQSEHQSEGSCACRNGSS
jgi:hypothetical protein